ncbi:MAG: alpha-2-macroglobulin [Tannerella sp.]|nr:alpha-2-macroglobulin [Tannerella sp.]
MKRETVFWMILCPFLLGFTLFSCRQNRDIVPPVEYAPYVSAYTGGVISTRSAVRLELTQEQPVVEPGVDLEVKWFGFSPALKGKTRWVNNRTLEFVPDSGELKPGTLYNATFALGKVVKVDRKLAEFNFSFRVEERDFMVKIMSPTVSADAGEQVAVTGEIHFSEKPSQADVERMITVSRGGESFQAVVEAPENTNSYRFTVSGIDQKEEESDLEIKVSGKAIQVNKTVSETVRIPAVRPFKLLSAEVIRTPDYGLQLTFSSPVSDSQDLNGLITLEGISSFVSQVQDNKINLFFERKNGLRSLNAKVDQGLKNIRDEKLNQTLSLSVELTSLDPKVELLTSGVILPDSKNLLLPFRAVSLRAVDVKIIRIFENNVLMFLQDNVFSQSSSVSSLRRAGRLVYKKTLRLDGDPEKTMYNWENYSLDLSTLIRQEPGAIYRVELSFKRNYAVYPCENSSWPGDEAAGAHPLTDLDSGEIGEQDNAVWDTPSAYYSTYYEDMNWEEYDWSERDNPCHASYYMFGERNVAVNVLSSDLGMIVKSNSNNQLWVAVSNLLDTRPVANAEVTAYNFQLQPVGSARTDENGFAAFTAKNKPFVVVASSRRQKAYLRMTDGEENLLSRFDVGGKDIQKGLKGYIYGERGVWRPGDTLHLSFMLEDRERRIPDSHPVSIEVYNPRGQFHTKQVSTGGLNGLYTFALPTRADDPTGLWNAHVKVGGTSFHKALRIETVKPNRLKVNLDISGSRQSATGAPASAKLRAAWLTGATAQHLKAKVETSLSEAPAQFKGYENYLFHNPAADFSPGRSTVFEGTLDDRGEAGFTFHAPPVEDAPGMLQANISCRVYEPGGDASFYYQTFPYSPFETYAGINFNRKQSGHYLETDVEHTFDVVTLDADGKPVNASALEYRIYRVGWSWWWGYEDKSYASYLQNASIKPVASGQLSTAGGKAQIKFQVNYPDWGSYLVYVKDRKGGHACGGTVYIDWPDWRGRSNRSNPDDVRMLTFSTEKTSYEAGEEATVIIPAAAGGRALVAVENGSEVLSREWVEIPASGDAKYTFTVTENMAPNIYVHVSLLQPHEQTANDLPIRMYGVVPLFVTSARSVLTPRIAMADVLRPETEFTVRVKEAAGKPMTYTLAVVDEGLLDLTNFKTPDPWNEFYAREALGIRTWDLYDAVIGSFAGRYGSILGVGGDGDLHAPDGKANRFRPVVRFIGPFALAKGKEQTHTLTLPPYIGSVRVMVVAGQGGAYGKAEKTAPVRTPLMILSSLPRTVSIDEEIVLPVNIFAMENEVKDVSVKVETSGKLRLTGSQQQSAAFSTPGDRMMYFTLKSGVETGLEKVTVTASGNGHTSRETIEIDVRNPNPPVLRATGKLLNPGESADFEWQSDGAFEGNWVKLEASRIPSIDLNRRFDYLYHYPHYCSEQLTSRALPLLFLSSFRELGAEEAAAVKTNVREAIASLYTRQLSSGGIAYWAGDSRADSWITSYAGSFLVMAKEKGYDVNESVLSRWKNCQRAAAQNWRPGSVQRRYADSNSEYDQAYRLYTLALAGVPETGAMNRLKEVKNLSQQACWRLAAAYALAGRENVAAELVFNQQTEVAPYSLNNAWYGSPYMDEALILETLILLGKEKDAFVLAQKVSRSLSGEDSFTTQTTAHALVAMARLAEKTSGTLQFDWSLNGAGQPAVKTPKAVFLQDLPLRPASGRVAVTNGGDGVLYVNLASKTRPLRDSLPAMASHIRLDVSYLQPDGSQANVSHLGQGQDIVAEIRVSNISGYSDYTNLALTQIIPSGWEIYNERMEQPEAGDTESTAYTYRDIRDDRVLTYFDLPRGKSRTFKVRLMASYAGDFVLPAVHCEAMYDANVQARTAAGRVTVKQ